MNHVDTYNSIVLHFSNYPAHSFLNSYTAESFTDTSNCHLYSMHLRMTSGSLRSQKILILSTDILKNKCLYKYINYRTVLSFWLNRNQKRKRKRRKNKIRKKGKNFMQILFLVKIKEKVKI